MPPGSNGESYVALDFGICNFSEIGDDGFLGIQVDVYGDKTGAPTFEVHSPFGFASRPLDPDDTGACSALYGYQGDTGHVWPGQDPRVTVRVPKLAKGASVQYGSDGTFLLLDPEKQTATLYVVTEKDDAGKPTKAHTVTVGQGANGKKSINILHAAGMCISIIEGGKNGIVIANKANNAWVEVNDEGVTLNGNIKISGNIGVGPLLMAYFTAIQAAGAAASPPIVFPPPPVSLTA